MSSSKKSRLASAQFPCSYLFKMEYKKGSVLCYRENRGFADLGLSLVGEAQISTFQNGGMSCMFLMQWDESLAKGRLVMVVSPRKAINLFRNFSWLHFVH